MTITIEEAAERLKTAERVLVIGCSGSGKSTLACLQGIVAGKRWIIDGTSPGTLPLRLPRTHLVLWLRPPRLISLYGVISRWLRYRGRSRPEMADDCPEKIDREFLALSGISRRGKAPRSRRILRHLDPKCRFAC